MCHSSVIENEQIEKCIENGMPKKIIKTIKNTMRRRAATEEITNKNQQQNDSIQTLNNNSDKAQLINPEEPPAFVLKCPFGHGKVTSPPATFLSQTQTLTPSTPTTTTTSVIDNEFNFLNNNNLYEDFPQTSQVGTTILTTADNGKAITNSRGHFDDDNKKLLLAAEKIVYNDDILAKSTQLTKEFAYTVQQAIRRLQSSKIYTLLTKTTQPAHLVAIAIVSFVILIVWPELIDNRNNDSSGQLSAKQQQHTNSVPRQEISVKKNDMLALIAYLGAFSTHFGAQIWMTFVSGLSLYFSLPRHIFGQCQQILFPKYFAMNAALSITMLILYAKYFINIWTLAKCVQLGSLALTGAIELLVRIYLAPPLLSLMHEKYKIEGIIGSGKEIGNLVQGDLIKCPHYQRIHKAFRRIHMIVAIGNIITMAGSCLQLYNIASQLQISLVN